MTRSLIGLAGVLVVLLAGYGCHKSDAFPAPAVSIYAESDPVSIQFAHLLTPPSLRRLIASTPKLDTEAGNGHSKATQARDFMQMKFRIPAWVVPPSEPKDRTASTPHKGHSLGTLDPDRGVVAGGGSVIKKGAGKAGASASRDAVGID